MNIKTNKMRITEKQYYEAIYENEEITSNGRCPEEHLNDSEIETIRENKMIIYDFDHFEHK